MAAQKENNTKNKNKAAGSLPLKVVFGDIMSSSFFGRNKFTIIIIVGLLMFYITIKYECQTRMETITRLETELDIVKSEGIREQSLYMSRTRESMMQHLVDTLHLGLKVQDQPPYKLSYDEK